jgi:hypothetical protein
VDLTEEYATNTTGMASAWLTDSRVAFEAMPRRIELRGRPIAAVAAQAFETAMGGIYVGLYDIQREGDEWVGVLRRSECQMPPRTPQISTFDDSARMPMMDEWGFSASLEAEQRKREWAEVLKTEAGW